MKKRPAEFWYTGDYYRAVDVHKCCAATRGIWRDCLDAMVNEQIRGKIRGTKEELCRLLRCTPEEFDNFVLENKAHRFCNVTHRNKKVTIICRRLYREQKQREATKKRVSEYRERVKRKCNKKVTPISSYSYTLNNNKDVTLGEFEQVRKIYPGTKRSCKTEYKNFKKHKDWQEVLPLLLPAVKAQTKVWVQEGTLKKFIPHFKTWINQRRWEQSAGQTVSPEQQKADEVKQLEKVRERMRSDYKQYYEEKETEELEKMLNIPKHLTRCWLIEEVLEKRQRDAQIVDAKRRLKNG